MAKSALPFRPKQSVQRVYTEEQFKVSLCLAKKELIEKVVKDYTYAIAIVLQDLLGFKNKRVMRFLNKVNELFSDINKGLITIDDVTEAVKDELKINLL